MVHPPAAPCSLSLGPLSYIPLSMQAAALFYDKRPCWENFQALAAHEFWHRQTEGVWAGLLRRKPGAKSGQGTASGLLLALDHGRDKSWTLEDVAVPVPVFLSICFTHPTMEVVVDFVVTEITHSDFEVIVIGERRAPKSPSRDFYTHTAADPDRAKAFRQDERAIQRSLVGTEAARGRVTTSNMVCSERGAAARYAAKIACKEVLSLGQTLYSTWA